MKASNAKRALRRPFLRELFRDNKFNLVMTVIAAVFGAAAELVISWLIKEVADLISGDCPYSFGTLLIITGGAFALFGLGWILDRTFLSEFRAKAIKQYREYVFDRILEKGIQAFSGENSSLYLSALSNDVNTIETDFIGRLQSTIQVGIAFVGALVQPAAYAYRNRFLSAAYHRLRCFGKQGGYRGKEGFRSKRELYRHAEGRTHGLLCDQEL